MSAESTLGVTQAAQPDSLAPKAARCGLGAPAALGAGKPGAPLGLASSPGAAVSLLARASLWAFWKQDYNPPIPRGL